MSDLLERIRNLSPKRLALLALELQEKLDAANAAASSCREPIAVIGMGCRFPGGASDPASYWELLKSGREGIREVPADRWNIDDYYDPDPDAPAHMNTRSGGFLDKVDGFDASFFGIAPREALTMDPQQRLILEVAWEALEHAGISPERLAGSPTGVFVGICNSDHFQRVLGRGKDAIDAYLASGNAHSVASGRLSYFLGLQGPSLSIDTACSSSLVALHVACRSLRAGESRTALAAGVNVMCAPETTIALSQAHMLAPDGRCKTFDAAADGFSRGEGCGVLVLKRLSDAIADGDRILALIRGTATNQDGRSGGLTVPSGPAQEAVIRAALADAGVTAAEIDYVEAHGTGTTLGDPIEVRALAAALGPGRASPLVIGSVKTNFGHLESAAGVAGLIKVILSLQNERIPPHLHFTRPSPQIAWSEYPVVVEPRGQPWPRSERRRLAGVSSFGFSGTNAHVIVEEAPLRETSEATPGPELSCLPISARTEPALTELAARYAAALSPEAGTRLVDAAHTAGVGRSHFAERLAVVASNEAEARAALAAFAEGAAHPGLFRAAATPGSAPEIVFLFTGQGAQYPGMTKLLYETSPVFRDVIDRCDALLGADAGGRTLKTVMATPSSGSRGEEKASANPLEHDDSPIHETRWTQPALFAVELALTQLWRSWGIEPAAVIGHSAGEYAAACAAGVFTLEEGLALIAERGRLMHTLPPGGTMAAIFAPIDEVTAAIARVSDRVSIAAVNAADSVVVAGEATAIDLVLADLEKRNVKGHRLYIPLAAHSPLVEPALAPLEAAARKVTMRPPRIPVAWNLTGGAPLPGGAPDATYWRRHMREPVRFADGIASLHREGYRVFLEVGPHPTLIALAQRSLPEGSLFLGSLRRGKDDWREMMTSLAALYVRGAPVDFAGVGRPYSRERVPLPTYPFQRRSWWIAPNERRARPARSGTEKSSHPLLGARLPIAAPVFESTLTPSSARYLAEHRVHGAVLVAGPVFVEMAMAAAREALGPRARAALALVIHEPLVLVDEGRTVQTSLADTAGTVTFSIHSRTPGGDWQLHASGRLAEVSSRASSQMGEEARLDLPALERTLGPATSSVRYYERLAEIGVQLGTSFRGLEQARRRDGEALATIALPASCAADDVAWVHPSILDAAFQAVGLAVPESSSTGDVYLLTEVDRIDLLAPLPPRLLCHARLPIASAPRPAEWRADVTLATEDGRVVGLVGGVCLRRASREALASRDAANVGGLFYRVVWEPAPLAIRAALEDPEAFVPRIEERFASIARERGLSIYEELLPELDRLSAEHVTVALRQLGFDSTVGRVFTADAEATRLGVLPRHARLFARMLDMLAEDGVLHRRGANDKVSYEVFTTLPSPSPTRRYEELLARFGEGGAGVDGELHTLRRCGGELARVLRGEQDPVQLLFPGGSLVEARKLYVESPYARTYNAALGDALEAAIAKLPAGARLRILEIGAGTGGTTTYVLPRLPEERADYTFTDISPLFLERAAEQLGARYPFLKRALLDIERDPSAQGFGAGAYDVVIAANVLHATADLRQAMQHVRQLLAPGGLLLLLEGMAPERWVDLTFGLTEGWWRFTDATLRPAYPLIDRAAWLELLRELGFTGGAAIPEDAASRGASQQALIVARAPARRKKWLLVGVADDAISAALASRLEDRGDDVALISPEATTTSAAPVDEIVYLGALGLTTLRADDASTSGRARALSCELAASWLSRLAQAGEARAEISSRVWLVTQGAQPANGEMSGSAHWQAPLWGLGRVFALEQPGRWGGLVDLQVDASPAALADTLLAAIDGDDGEDQTAWRDGARLAARLVPANVPEPRPIHFAPDATYLVTGGFGGLGLLVARWMAEHGARHIALLGRRPDPASDGVRAIEALGARVIALAGDVADEAAMTAVLDRLGSEAPPLRGIMHAAADLSAAPLGELTRAQVTRMLRPKVDATVLLERLTRPKGLDFLVLFSSTTALLGASGLAHYAAANAFLDAFALTESRRGRRVLSINWGTWEAMRLASSEAKRSYKDAGLEPMPATAALDALGRLLGGSDAQAVVARVDWAVLKPLHEARRRRPFLSRLAVAEPARREARAGSGPSLTEQLAGAPAAQRHDVLVRFVRQEVGAALAMDADAVPLDTGLFELGMDSLMSVELKRRLERAAGRSLPSTLTFNYPNVAALAGFLERELGSALLGAEPASAPLSPAAAPAARPRAPSGDELDALSDAELEARLLARLERQ